jgi:hypothetical protein
LTEFCSGTKPAHTSFDLRSKVVKGFEASTGLGTYYVSVGQKITAAAYNSAMANHEVMDVRFKVYEWGDGKPYLAPLEGGPETNSVLNDKNLFSIHLKASTTLEEARELVWHLNRFATKLGLTFIP